VFLSHSSPLHTPTHNLSAAGSLTMATRLCLRPRCWWKNPLLFRLKRFYFISPLYLIWKSPCVHTPSLCICLWTSEYFHVAHVRMFCRLSACAPVFLPVCLWVVLSICRVCIYGYLIRFTTGLNLLHGAKFQRFLWGKSVFWTQNFKSENFMHIEWSKETQEKFLKGSVGHQINLWFWNKL